MTDRVDVIRSVKRQDPSGVSRPSPTVVMSGVPCRIVYGAGRPDITSISDLITDQSMVAFAQDVGIRNDDILHPVPPTSGSDLKVGSYRFDTALKFYVAICIQTK